MPRLQMKTQVGRKTPAANGPRYEARFVNGVHTVFDRHNFGHGQGLGTAKAAEDIADKLNRGVLKWAA
jgi:hypothetical protein